MPKHLTKGKYFEAAGERYSDPVRRLETLARLRKGDPIEDLGTFEEAHKDDAPAVRQRNIDAAKRHLRDDWFGGRQGFSQTNGWWQNWRGDAEKIYREGMIRAIEVSLGLEHEAEPTPENITRRPPLPVDIYWICGPPDFDIFVSWNKQQVTVLIITPEEPGEHKHYKADTPPALNSWVRSQEKGMLWVGQHPPGGQQHPDHASGAVSTVEGAVEVHHLDVNHDGAGVWTGGPLLEVTPSAPPSTSPP